ncbi:MAG: polysaccharide deacetylase family protein [Clostridia bacterium]|nr:polysaccharide deacetylase family protein [Clostridia bacterium]
MKDNVPRGFITGAVVGIVAAFLAISLIMFIPLILNSRNASALSTDTGTTTAGKDVPSDDTTGPVSTGAPETTAGPDTEGDSSVTVYVTDTGPESAGEATGTAPDTTKEITDTASAETEPDTTAAPDTTVAPETTTVPETTKAPETTAPETTKAQETTKEPETTKAPETTEPVTLPITTAEVKPLDPEKKYVAFTFDDGPDATRSKLITDKMLEYGGKCTFFVVGNLIYGDREKGMQYAYEHGMEIGLHCWSHEWYYTKNPEKYHDEVYKGAEAIKKSIGEWPTIMRPPGGNITESQYKSSEFAVIIWDVDSNDWRYKKNGDRTQRENIDIIVDNIMKDVKPGSIILMHEIYENSYLAFCEAIEKLAAQGYEFVTVSELLQNPSTGYKYYSANSKR